jgi:FkbM family methyltransferase
LRGTYRDPELRRQAREQWAKEHVPAYGYGEVRPLRPLLSRSEGLVAIDVGANKGFWTKAFLNNFPGQVAHVHMLDPSPENFRELSEREDSLLFDPGDFALVTAHNVAAGAEPGEALLYTNEDGSPLASLHPHALTERLDRTIPTQVVTIDGFMAEQGIAHADVLKMDVEGHEFAVLEGADEALRAGRIDVLIWEFGMHQVEARRFFVDFWRFLTERGYDLYEHTNIVAKRIERYEHRFENFTDNFTFSARRRAAPSPTPPAGFSEEGYLAANRDVAKAVARGDFASGLQHWLQFGYREDRRLSPA